MGKFIFFVIALGIGYVVYNDGIKPYSEAQAEENALLEAAGLTAQDKATDKNRSTAMELLKDKCSKGFYEHTRYEFGCKSDSLLPFLD